jgi:hypothetical protein
MMAQLPRKGHVPWLLPVQQASGVPAAVQMRLGSHPLQPVLAAQAIPL